MNDHEFRNKIKKSSRKRLNRLAKELNDRVFQDIDCLSCAKCCQGIPPIIDNEDIYRISSAVDLTPDEFEHKHTTIDEDGDRVLISSPCMFLLEDKRCSIYPLRPKACKEYPLLENKFVERLDYHLVNKTVCPATEKVLNQIDEALDWL